MRRMKSVNMLLFPGGAASLEASSPFFKSAKWMFEMALKFNTNGDYFPVHGTATNPEHILLNTFPQHILSVLICTTHLGGRHVSWL